MRIWIQNLNTIWIQEEKKTITSKNRVLKVSPGTWKSTPEVKEYLHFLFSKKI
jgi:hypothetical protein